MKAFYEMLDHFELSYDPPEFIEKLGIGMEDLLDALEAYLWDNVSTVREIFAEELEDDS